MRTQIHENGMMVQKAVCAAAIIVLCLGCSKQNINPFDSGIDDASTDTDTDTDADTDSGSDLVTNCDDFPTPNSADGCSRTLLSKKPDNTACVGIIPKISADGNTVVFVNPGSDRDVNVCLPSQDAN